MTEQPRPELRVELEQLRRELRSRSRGVGYKAADGLAAAGAPGRQILLNALESRDRQVRLHAAWAVRLLDSPEAVARLVELLRQDPEVYLPLQQALPAEPPPAILEPLLEAARDRKNAQRKFHVMLLGDVEGPGVLDTLLVALQSDDSALQEGAFLAFKHARAELRTEAAGPLLQALSVRLPLPRRLPWLLTRRARARSMVALALITAAGVVGGEESVGLLNEIVRSDAHEDYRVAAVSALTTVGEPAVGRSWRALLSVVESTTDGELEAVASEALRRLRCHEAESGLLALLAAGKPYQRRNAVHALEGCGSSDSVAAVTRALREDADVHVRRTAARTLAKLGPDYQPLLAALRDSDRWVGYNAAWALGHLQDERVLGFLVRGLEDKDRRFRRSCAEALGQLGKHTPEVVEALVHVLDQTGHDVARTAAWTLRQLDLAEALSYATQLRESPDARQRRLGARALKWLQPERASYAPHLPLRSSRLAGLVASPDEKSRGLTTAGAGETPAVGRPAARGAAPAAE